MTNLPRTRREAVLARFLHMPLVTRFVNRKVFDSGSGSQDEIVTSSRLILILAGKMTYSMETKVFQLGAGTQFFVPAWIRRVWKVAPGNTCEIAWCEFDDDALDNGETTCVQRKLEGSSLLREKRSHLELFRLYRNFSDNGEPELELLGMEAIIKSALARFWMNAKENTETSASVSPPFLHPAVKHALRRMERHYQNKNLLESIYADCELTPNYFRNCFKDGMKCSPQEYLQRLRMRHARHLIQSTQWQQKRIAVEVGYDDPLYFSRLYTRFWGHSPTTERDTIKRQR
jgi:AraC-like DNA-binding protein